MKIDRALVVQASLGFLGSALSQLMVLKREAVADRKIDVKDSLSYLGKAKDPIVREFLLSLIKDLSEISKLIGEMDQVQVSLASALIAERRQLLEELNLNDPAEIDNYYLDLSSNLVSDLRNYFVRESGSNAPPEGVIVETSEEVVIPTTSFVFYTN